MNQFNIQWKKAFWIRAFIFGFGMSVLGSCTKMSDSDQAKRGDEKGVEGAAKSVSIVAKKINLAIWSNYITPERIKAFETLTGVQVEVSNYSSNEELLAKLQTGASGYDVIVPSDYMIVAMSKLGLLLPLNSSLISNKKGIDPELLKKSFDPENKWTLPYSWGTTGVVINHALFAGQVKSWKQLFTAPELKGKFSLLDDSREVIAAALKALGFSLNSRDPGQLQKAKELLIAARKNVKAFNTEVKEALIQKEVAIAHAYSTDALQAVAKMGEKVEYFVPEEGGTLWIDNLAIPATAKNIEEAHAFVNYMLDPKTGLESVNHIWVAPASLETFALLSPTLQNNRALFPSPQLRAKLERFEDLGPALELWDRIWTEVKVAAD